MRKALLTIALALSFVWPTMPDGITTGFMPPVHNGIDIAAPYGREVRASEWGTVAYAGWDMTGYGYRIDVSNGTNTWRYAHLNTVEAYPGQQVVTGQRLGSVGSSGISTGPHLHLEVYWLGQTVNPLVVLPSL